MQHTFFIAIRLQNRYKIRTVTNKLLFLAAKDFKYTQPITAGASNE
tara:strand:- start:784 stop:921 length:138 start_codon:yes stop_codon:yes gene_type:complete